MSCKHIKPILRSAFVSGVRQGEAALRPADGDWLYFVTVNLKTGETKFSVTLGEHERAAQEFYAWLRENPDWND